MERDSTLGHYRIVQKLGSGGMGDVYLAHDTTLGRNVALKILPPDVADHPERRDRFEREARAIAALNHPNIVTIHSIQRDGGRHFIAMEYVSGTTLSAWIPPQGLPLTRFFQFALPLVDAVHAAHAQGVTHRDLKPDNVMVSEDGRVKVLDFGLAKFKAGWIDDRTETGAPSPNQRTVAGQVLGTIAYMSPEQAEGQPVDHRSDVFSLGIILHEMITGRRPFNGGSHASIVSSILRDTAPPVTDINPSLPPALAQIIQRCLAKDRALRYQVTLDLKNDLDALERDLVAGGPVRLPPPTGHAPKTSSLAITLSVAAAVLLAMTIVWWRSTVPLSQAEQSLRDAAFSQLTHESGEELFPSLAPDGRTFLFAGAADGDSDIHSQRVGGENAINLTSDTAADDTQPAFSPDGERIVFRSERDGGGLFVMGATGESVRRVSDFGYHPAWSPDGEHIVCVTQNVIDPATRFSTGELWIVTVASGQKRLLASGDAAQPHWSPNGDRIAYWGRPAGGGAGDIWTVPAAGGPPVAVASEPSLDWNPVWSPDGRHLYFSSDRGGSMNLWRVAIDERSGEVQGRPEAVTTGGGASSQHLTVSADGRRIAYVSRAETMNLQRVTFDPVAGTVVGTADWVTRGSRSVSQPELSPDGTLLAFNSTGKQEDIFTATADGKSVRQLTDDAFKDRAARWSPDGTRIAFYSDRTGKYEIWVVNRDGSSPRQLTQSPGAHYPVWSPDGRSMAYSTHSPNGAGIFSLETPWEAQQPRMLPAIPDPTQSFEVWSWSPDGRFVAGQKHLADLSHAGIALHEIGSTTLEWLTDVGEWPVWMRDGQRLLFSHRGGLFLLDRRSRKYREVLTLPQNTLGSVGLSADNRTIHITHMNAEADVWLMTMK